MPHDQNADATDARTKEGIEDENLTTVVILANRRRIQAGQRYASRRPPATAEQLIDAAVRRWRMSWMPSNLDANGGPEHPN
jgi:hypothetical protein